MSEQRLAFIFLLAVAFGLFGWTMSRFTLVLLQARTGQDSFRNWPARVRDVLAFFFGQRSVARERSSLHHLPIFWGFLVITVGTVEILINGAIPAFSYEVLGATPNKVFKAALDLTNAAVLLVIGYSFYRRIVRKPNLIPMNFDAGLILGMIAALCLTHFLAHGLHFVATEGVPTRFQHASLGPVGDLGAMPISAAVFRLFGGLDPDSAHTLSGINYWIHVLIILFFLNYIPYSKHQHLLGALPNILLRNRGQAGVLPKLDLEDETQWGVGRYEQWNWKAMLDSYACTECARCSNNCPAMATDKPLSPMHLVLDLKDEMQTRGELLMRLSPAGRAALEAGDLAGEEHHLHSSDKDILRRIEDLPPLIGGRIKEETLWACTTCGACETNCPVFIEHPLKIMRMRTNLVLEHGQQPAELARIFRGIENNCNPWGVGADQRMNWASDLDIPIMAEKGSAEYLVWIGCAGSYDDRGKKISRDWIALLQQAGVDFAVLGDEEGCTGDAARRAGNEFLFQMMAETNVETLAKYDVKKILVSCPHCYHSFKNEYPAFGGNYEVWHHSQFLQKLVQDGKLTPKSDSGGRVVYHDPCYLGRWNDEYEQPRAVVEKASGGRAPIEMPRNRTKSFCCGAGGARLWVEEDEPRVNVVRTREAVATGAQTIATACPFCNVMLGDGLKSLDKDDDVTVLDIAQILAKSTGAEAKLREQKQDS
jgi:Fe-S oxidoreductase